MDAISIVSVALIGLLIIGFILGFARSWKSHLLDLELLQVVFYFHFY